MAQSKPVDPSTLAPPRCARGRWSRIAQRLLGIALLVPWLALWGKSFIWFEFATRKTWVPVWSFMGVDIMHVTYAVRAWAQGNNPLVVDIGDPRGSFSAPPIVLPLFAWTRWFDHYMSTLIWAIAIAFIVGRAAYLCVKAREALGLWAPSSTLAVAVMLWSTPVLFSMERGNLDVWVLLTLFIATALMTARRIVEDVLAGLVLAVGAWTKVYPGLLVFGLLTFGRWRVALAMAAGILLIGVVPLEHTRQFFRNASRIDQLNRVAPLQETAEWMRDPQFGPYTGPQRPLKHYEHSLISVWPLVLGNTFLGSVPGLLGTAAILAPVLLYGSFKVYRSRRRDLLFYPYALWVIALGTYALPISYDYNLMFLLLASLALWDVRDGIWLHVMMLPVALWWQPIALPMSAEAFIYVKLFSIVPVTILLVKRAREEVDANAARASRPWARVPTHIGRSSTEQSRSGCAFGA